MFYRYLNLYTTEYVRRRAVAKKMGPNDVSDIVWALGEFFLKIFCVFIYTNISFVVCIPFLLQTTRDIRDGGW